MYFCAESLHHLQIQFVNEWDAMIQLATVSVLFCAITSNKWQVKYWNLNQKMNMLKKLSKQMKNTFTEARTLFFLMQCINFYRLYYTCVLRKQESIAYVYAWDTQRLLLTTQFIIVMCWDDEQMIETFARFRISKKSSRSFNLDLRQDGLLISFFSRYSRFFRSNWQSLNRFSLN